MAHTFKPDKPMSVRSILADETDRKKMNDSFKERKGNQERIKTERFAKIEERRKVARAGKGRGINVEVTGDNQNFILLFNRANMRPSGEINE